MTAFNVPIKIDDGDSNAKIDRFEQNLAKAEKRSDELTRACERLSRNFQGLGAIMEARARATELHNRLNNNLANSFDLVGKAIQREKAMLVSIRGDMDRYQQDVQTLDSLMRRGAITASEYAAALARSRSQAGMANPAAAVSLPAAPTVGLGAAAGGAIAGQLAGIAGPAAIAATAIAGITSALDTMAQKAEATRNATAAMLDYKDTVEGARESVERMRDIADLLRDDLANTTDMFLNVADAAQDLGLSEEKLTDITRALGLTAEIKGKSLQDVAGVMVTLEHAIAKGSISSGELERIMKRFGPIAEIWQREFGGTRKELIAAAESGELARLGLDRLLTSIKTTPEMLQKMEQRLEATRGGLMDTGIAWYKQKDALDVAKAALAATGDQVETIGRQLGDSTQKIGLFSGALRRLGDDKWGDSIVDRARKGLGDIARVHKERMEDVKEASEKARKSIEQLAESFERMQRSQIRATIGVLPTGQAAIDAEADRLYQEYLDGRSPDPDLAADLAAFEARQPKVVRLKKPVEMMSPEQLLEMHNGVTKLDKAWAELSDNMEAGVLRQVQSLGDHLADFFQTGEFGWKKFVDTAIREMTRLAIQQAVMFGFKAAFPSIGGSAGLSLRTPGFSGGGTARVDTDSQFVGLRVTPNERIIVQTPGQQMRSDQAPAQQAAAPRVVVRNSFDRRELLDVLDSPEGATVVHNLIRKYPGLRR